MSNNLISKKIVPAIAIAVGSFAFLNIVFIFYAAIVFLFERILRTGGEGEQIIRTMPYSMGLATLIIILAGWFIFRSKIPVILKAIYLSAPVAVALVFIGISSYGSFWAYPIGGLVSLAVLFYLYIKKQPWEYYFSVIFVSLVLLIMGIFGVEI